MASTEQGSHARRLEWIDAARGGAALVVVLQHLVLRQNPGAFAFVRDFYNPGLSAITCFFLVSGFVIPQTLERMGSASKFWVNRAFRIYPLYWFSLLLAFILASLGYTIYESGLDLHNPRHLFANLFAVQFLLRTPHVMGVYWTLGIELLFYAICTVVFLLTRRVHLVGALTLLAVALIIGLVPAILVGNRFFMGPAFVMLLCTLLGAVFQEYSVGRLSKRSLWMVGTVAAVAAAGIAYVVAKYPNSTDQMLQWKPHILFLSWFGGFVYFGIFYALREGRMPKPLVYLGVICYSMYLMHTLVLIFFPEGKLLLGFLIGVPCVVVLASIGYYLVEAPTLRFARKLSGRAVGLPRDQVVAGKAGDDVISDLSISGP